MDFLDLCDRYYAPVRKFILLQVRDEWVADDLVQETFLRVQAGLLTLKDPSKVSPWVYRIARNICYDYFRQQKNTPQTLMGDKLDRGIPSDASFPSELERLRMNGCIHKKISLLSKKLREPLILFDLMELSHQEVAEVIGISVEAVKVRLHRARKKLRYVLEEACTFDMDERNVLICEPRRHAEYRLPTGSIRIPAPPIQTVSST